MVEGNTSSKFSGVRAAFEGCFADGLEHGAAVAVYADGQQVVDLWGGYADAAQTKAWRADTMVNIWSATKGVVALAVAMLVERGTLDYDAPLASVWTEFAANGKQEITLGMAMSHQAGLNGLDVPMTLEGLYAWDPYVEALAGMTPLWEPGSRCVYHAISYGHLAGEAIRRADGRTPGRFIAEEIAVPLGLDMFVGLPESREPDVAEIIEGPGTIDWVEELANTDFGQAVRNPSFKATSPNTPAWRAAEIPGANGTASARALADIYGALACGGEINSHRLITDQGLAKATCERYRGVDAGTQMPAIYGAGFRLEDQSLGNRLSLSGFGHTGWGGTVAFADPDVKLGFAYTTCWMRGFDPELDPRRIRLIDAVYDAIESA